MRLVHLIQASKKKKIYLVYNAKKISLLLKILRPITFKLRTPGERMHPTPTPIQYLYLIFGE